MSIFLECFFHDGPLSDAFSNTIANSATACQAKCKEAQTPRAEDSCLVFSYVVETKECLLFGGKYMARTSATNNTVISGPPVCGKHI